MRTVGTLLVALLLSACGAASPPGEGADDLTPGAEAPAAPEASEQSPAESSAFPQPDNPLASAAEREAKKQGKGKKIPPRHGLVLGGDVSYPNCPKGMGIPQRETLGNPMPKPEAEFVVIGLTNGPAYFPNPCLSEQVAWAEQRKMMVAAYSVLSFPDDRQLREHGADGPYDATTRLGRLRNAGHAQADFNMDSMKRTGLETPMVWIDIEPVSDWEWRGDVRANVAVITGAIQGYRDAGYRVGFYSVPSLWANIAGDWGVGIPEWRSAGETSQRQALTRCRGAEHSIQGGRAILAQWWDAKRDYNVTCPGVAADLSRWFHQY